MRDLFVWLLLFIASSYFSVFYLLLHYLCELLELYVINICRSKPYGTPHFKWKSPYAPSTGMHNTWGIYVELPLTVTFSLNQASKGTTCYVTAKQPFWLRRFKLPFQVSLTIYFAIYSLIALHICLYLIYIGFILM